MCNVAIFKTSTIDTCVQPRDTSYACVCYNLSNESLSARRGHTHHVIYVHLVSLPASYLLLFIDLIDLAISNSSFQDCSFVGSRDVSLFRFMFVLTCCQNIIMQLYRVGVKLNANLAKRSIQQCEWTEDGKHLTMASLDRNDDKGDLSLNNVAIAEYLGLTFLKSNVAVSLNFDVWNFHLL